MTKAKKSRTAAQASKPKATKQTAKAARQTAIGKARAEGLRLYRVAGKPTCEQVILVCGERGPVMSASVEVSSSTESKALGAVRAAPLFS